jgi:serine kinase of HPr protein (carbohydrate metabolism regulator)
MTPPIPTAHASAVLVGAHAVLIRGRSGSGKSRLALALIEAAGTRLLPFARLVADDRVVLEAHHGRLVVSAPAALAGLIEVHGLGIRRLPHEPMAVVGLVIDLAAGDAQRWPTPQRSMAVIAGMRLPRIAVAADADPLPLVLALLQTEETGLRAPAVTGDRRLGEK